MATLPIRVGWFANPRGSNRAYPNDLRTWAQRNAVLLSTTALTQPQVGSSIDTDLPPRQRAYPSSLRTYTRNVNLNLIGKDALLPQRNRYDTSLPIGRPYPVSLRTWTQNLQQTTLGLRTLVLNGDVGSYSLTGLDAQFVDVLPDDVGIYSVTGSDAALLGGYVLSGAVGSYSVTGLAAGLISSVLPTLATRAASFANTPLGSRGAYQNDLRTWARRNTTLLATLTPQQIRDRIQTSLPVRLRDYSITLRTWTQNLHQTTLAPRALVLGGDVGSYSITGSAAQFAVVESGVGSYSITGSAAQFAIVEPWTVGSYSVTGSAAQFVTAVHVLPGAVGSYSVTGLATNLIFSGAVIVPPVVIQPGGGGVWGAVGGTSRQPRDRRRLKVAARSGAYSLSGYPTKFIVVRHYRLRIDKAKRKNYQIFSGYPNSRRTYVMPRPSAPFIVTLNGAPANGKCNSFETIMRAMDRKRVIDNNNIFLLAA